MLGAFTSGCATSPTQTKTEPPNTAVVHLLNGQDLAGFYTYLKDSGKDSDPDGVFAMTNGMLRISGRHMGYLATQQEYSNYRLVAEFKWGNATWTPRQFKARESGIMLNAGGPDALWPKSIECVLGEGGTGDVLVLNGARLNAGGVSAGPQTERFDRPGRNPWKDELGFHGTNEFENPHGEWNTVEIISGKDYFYVAVNGHRTLWGNDASPCSGKILLLSDAAEVFFRRLDLYPIH